MNFINEQLYSVKKLILFQVNNTDAEGRLTLADALVYACNQGVDKVRLFFSQSDIFSLINLILLVPFENSVRLKSLQIVDLATLTGACIVALGPSIAGIIITKNYT